MVMESYLLTHTPAKSKKRGKRKRVNELDPNASKSDKRYQDDYGL